MTTPAAPPAPVLSRLVAVDEIPPAGLAVSVVPDAGERDALARLNGLVALNSMMGALQLRHEPGGGVRVTGEVVAEVVQTCVVTLEPFDAAVRERVDVEFLPQTALATRMAAKPRTREDEREAADDPDPIVDGRIDVGALAAEHLTLGLDPYPRKPGAALPPLAGTEPVTSPFAVLRARGEDQS